MSTKVISSHVLDKPRTVEPRAASLPVTRKVTLAYASSLVIALIMAVTSAAGLLLQTDLYPAGEPLYAFMATDSISLVVGLPVLLCSMWLARRGKLLGLLCWPGALLYVLYIHVTKAIGVPFGVWFLPYLVLVMLSAYTVIGLVSSIDGEKTRKRLAGAVPDKLAGGILFGISVLFFLVAVSQIIEGLNEQTQVGASEISHWIADGATLCPVWLMGGLLLWRRQALGYVAGAALLLLGSILFIGVIPVMVFSATYTNSPIDVGGIIQMLVMGMICFVPLGFFVRGILRSDHNIMSAQAAGI